jgi:hypothetical protein
MEGVFYILGFILLLTGNPAGIIFLIIGFAFMDTKKGR